MESAARNIVKDRYFTLSRMYAKCGGKNAVLKLREYICQM